MLSYSYRTNWSIVSFFFFQAEDGIRDWSVTGVQTCALPISSRMPSLRASTRAASGQPSAKNTFQKIASVYGKRARSEERRVGKECRSRWWRSHHKKNENDTADDERDTETLAKQQSKNLAKEA